MNAENIFVLVAVVVFIIAMCCVVGKNRKDKENTKKNYDRAQMNLRVNGYLLENCVVTGKYKIYFDFENKVIIKVEASSVNYKIKKFEFKNITSYKLEKKKEVGVTIFYDDIECPYVSFLLYDPKNYEDSRNQYAKQNAEALLTNIEAYLKIVINQNKEGQKSKK